MCALSGAAPQLKLFPTEYTATAALQGTSLATSAAILHDRSSHVYMTALEKAYLIT